ncbi:arsenate reductase family protein [Lutispora thermophila]|uniref:Transcriptional regulator, Spx/MgsR family n=1 Tax=Lutispora thermophila DSM 19022 TaxID=1122184 RepID=A0A1M6IYK0_9FIRM|nr:arsenate reductase family protein [Lutispora thermophila]SHJ39513.1 transcriptional regulator, Spx/MgsR family [Lutispora thermophila DSM 19022]
MNIQIFGRNKCFDTKKAERYFKERNIKFQFIDLNMKGLSKRELESVIAAVGLNDLFDTSAKNYEKLNLHKITNKSIRQELLLNNPDLYKTPIVRNGRQATVGYKPEVWKTWE